MKRGIASKTTYKHRESKKHPFVRPLVEGISKFTSSV